MAEVEVPSEPYATSQPPAGWPHRHIMRAVIPLLLVVIVIVAGLLLADRDKSKTGSTGTAHLVLNDTKQSKIITTDKSGKQLFSLAYPEFSYMNVEAASPKGSLLLSRGIGSTSEGFVLLVNGKDQNLPAASTKALHSAIVLNGSHQVYFADENDLLYVTCPSGKNCQLMNLKLDSGQTKTLADTGAKPVIATLPPVYLLGVSPDGKTAYVRTLAANKLGKNVGGVYALNLDGKVTNNWALDQAAGYTPRLSPDAKQIVYKTGNKDSTSINNLNLTINKTYKAKWTGGEITSLPTAFSWSPDSKKVFFWGSDSILPRPKADTSFDIKLAYLDIGSSKITDLQVIKDSAHNQVAYHGWLDNDNVIYEQDTTTQAYAFSNSTAAVFKQNIGSKAIAKFNNLSGQLNQVVYY
jgi:hypothetical protein